MLFPSSGVNLDSKQEPSSSHVSAPSKLPMVTSNSQLDVFLHHGMFSLKSRYFFAWMMIAFSSSVISSCCEANVRASVRSSSGIDG